MRARAHKAFDPLWLGNTRTRRLWYALAAEALGRRSLHISQLNEGGCRKLITWAKRKLAERETQCAIQ
jgi:hypothetical protein